MQDYNELLKQAQNELSRLQQQEAIYKSKIDDLCKELGLVNDDTLLEQAKSLRSDLETQIEESNSKIDELLKQLK